MTINQLIENNPGYAAGFRYVQNWLDEHPKEKVIHPAMLLSESNTREEDFNHTFQISYALTRMADCGIFLPMFQLTDDNFSFSPNNPMFISDEALQDFYGKQEVRHMMLVFVRTGK